MREEFQRTLIAAQGYCELQMYDDGLLELNGLAPEMQDHPMTVEMRLVILMQAHRWPEALESSLRLCSLRPEAGSGFIHAAFCLHEMGQTAAARERLLLGPACLQKEANFFYNLACYECVLGNLESAEHHLAASVAMDKKYREYATNDPDLEALRIHLKGL